jgi:hypothetical protein
MTLHGRGRNMALYGIIYSYCYPQRGVITDVVGESCNKCSNTIGTFPSLDFTRSGKMSVF